MTFNGLADLLCGEPLILTSCEKRRELFLLRPERLYLFSRNFEVGVFDDSKDVSKWIRDRRYSNSVADVPYVAVLLGAEFQHPPVCFSGIFNAPISYCIGTFRHTGHIRVQS